MSVDFSSGIEVVRATDIAINGGRQPVAITRVYVSSSTNSGPFGIGTSHNYGYVLDVSNFVRGTGAFVTLDMPDGNQYSFAGKGAGTFVNSAVPMFLGALMTNPATGTYILRWSDGTTFTFQASAQGPITAFLNSIQDRNGNTITLVHGNSAQPALVSQVVDTVGRTLTLTYDSSNRITSITDPIGRSVSYSYNSQGTLATVTDLAGGVTTYGYDSQNRLNQITDPRGVVIAQQTYDANGRVIQEVEADGGILKFSYPTLLNPLVPVSPILLTVITDALGNQTTYRFDPSQFLSDVTDASGQTTHFTRSAQQNNRVTAITGTATCPICGDPASGDQAFTFDSNGNILTRTDALGNATTYTYDPVFGQITSVTDPLGNVTKYRYDSKGNRTSVTDPDGNTTSFAYNSFGQVTQITDPVGGKTVFSYDTFGNSVSMTDPVGNTTRFIYDAVSRVQQVVDPLGRTTSVSYDPLDRLLARQDPQGHILSSSYDHVGNLLSIIDESGNKTSFTYDAMSRLVTRTDPRGKTDMRSYDLNSNLIKFVDRLGQTSTFSYDALNRPTSEGFQDGSKVSRSYDARGQLVHVVDSVGGTFDFAYDAVGRGTSSSSQFGTTQYSYDAAGKVSSLQVVGQSAVTYSYDAAGNLLSAAQPQTSATLSFDAGNRLTSITRANGVSSQYTYDAAGQLLSLTHSGGQGVQLPLTYSYDAGNNRSSYTTNFALPQTLANTFDPFNRLVQSGTASYSYDDNGNLSSTIDTTGTTAYTWDARNRLSSISAPSGQRTTFLYDFASNLISQVDSGPSLNLTQNFVLDDLTNIAYINRSNGDSVSVLSGRSVDQDLAVVHATGQAEYGLPDAMNSTIATVDQNGKVASSFSYEPFGRTTTTSTYPFQFTGRVPVTGGLYYYRARYYSPCTGRFISEDPAVPFGDDYLYSANDPLLFSDPTGLQTELPANVQGCFQGATQKYIRCETLCANPVAMAGSGGLICTVKCLVLKEYNMRQCAKQPPAPCAPPKPPAWPPPECPGCRWPPRAG